ncbi:MarR family winged helix-turn-helix transcriptional regulator [Actinopolyspora sp. H202]|uniref:MarR family winged helix-turn-helix transcriptional regulator n=1 Tax=Actinopolyspora sp. H202 TaxID=1500456 RepID=UPI003EE791A3
MSEHETRPPSLLSLPSYLAGHVARIGHRALDEALAERGLRLPHFAVLTALSDFGPLTQHVLADRLRFNRSHLVGYLDKLEQRELVRRERHPEDRRRHRITLTSAGVELAGEMAEVARSAQRELLSPLTSEERDTLVELLGRVLDTDDSGRNVAADRATD